MEYSVINILKPKIVLRKHEKFSPYKKQMLFANVNTGRNRVFSAINFPEMGLNLL